MGAQTCSFIWMKIFLLLNCILLIIGCSCGPLITRLYFIKGGERVWLSCFFQTAGFPVTFIPLAVAYVRRCRSATGAAAKVFLMEPGVLLGSTIVGVVNAVAFYCSSSGISRLPVSTGSLISATQLSFTAAFSFVLLKQKFTQYSVNAIVLLTVGAVVLGLHASDDKPAGELGMEYAFGFCLMMVAAALVGLMLPLIEMTYRMAKQAVTYPLVVEIQMTIGAVSSGVFMMGMLVNNDFQAIQTEAKQFELGERSYYLVLFSTSIVLQCVFLGCVGVIFHASSLLSGIIMTLSIPITQILAVIVNHEKFRSDKGVALFLCLWGFAYYFYGEMKHSKVENDEHQDAETDQMTPLLLDEIILN